jgi:hypothetical protein
VRTSTGALVRDNVPVGADGSWVVDARGGPTLPTGATLTVTSTSGADLTGVQIARTR